MTMSNKFVCRVFLLLRKREGAVVILTTETTSIIYGMRKALCQALRHCAEEILTFSKGRRRFRRAVKVNGRFSNCLGLFFSP